MPSLKLEVEGKDILKIFNNIPRECEIIVDEEINKFMKELKESSQNYHPWLSKTGVLEDSHEFVKLDTMDWEFTVNTKIGGDDYDYAPLLEYNLLNYSRNYTWINPQFARLKPQLIFSIQKRMLWSRIKQALGF